MTKARKRGNRQKMENENTSAQEVDIEKLQGSAVGQIELPKVDVQQYIGKEVQIVSIVEKEGQHGFFVELKTEIVETIERTDKDDIQLCGQKNLGLHKREDGIIGWGKDTKTDQYLKKMRVKSYKELMGAKVKLQTHTKDGTDFLTFN